MLKDLQINLIKCNLNCEGIKNDPKKGVIPRCLVLEEREGKNNCIVVGLNPGKCNKQERRYLLKNGIKFNTFSRYFFESGLKDRPYFKRTRDLITLLGFRGDILWTDLAKCECLGKNGKLPVQTLRVCIDRYLRKEVEMFECSTIFALGNVAFDFCALSFPDHFVVGLPHPSGSYGDFYKLKKRVKRYTKYYLKNISKTKDSNHNYQAIQLSKI
ncbi:MAG: uracil-DNA glycosylase family protein [Patescibacteria group bacterium]|nr:uracil-DNA glycosylase family protein [Patescibacteria group bacterium]